MDPKYINNQLRKNINKNIANRSQSAVEYQLPVIISMVTEPSLASLCMQPVFYVFFSSLPLFSWKVFKTGLNIMIFSSSSANWEKYSLRLCHIPEQIFPSSDDCFGGVTFLTATYQEFFSLNRWGRLSKSNRLKCCPANKYTNREDAKQKNVLSNDTAFRNLQNHKFCFFF